MDIYEMFKSYKPVSYKPYKDLSTATPEDIQDLREALATDPDIQEKLQGGYNEK